MHFDPSIGILFDVWGIKLRRESLQGEGYSLQMIEPSFSKIPSRFRTAISKPGSAVNELYRLYRYNVSRLNLVSKLLPIRWVVE